MKKYLLILFVVLAVSCTFQSGKKTGEMADNRIVIGRIDSLYSHVLSEERKIWVYVPDTGNSIYSPRKYPVVYLLDGDAHFSSVVGMIQQLSSVNGNDIFPEMIIVGIPNTDRTRDLTPTHVAHSIYINDSSQLATSGGGENFMSFIQNELIPHIDSLYPTASYRMLIGHSFGGLTAVNTLIHHTGLFNSYIAIDPSMWWDEQKLLHQADTILKQNHFDHKSLYMSIANTMDPGMDTLKVRKDTSEYSMHIRSILKFKDDLAGNPHNGLKWKYDYYMDDSHGSVPLISEYNGLRFIFGFYPMPAANKFFDKDYPPDSCLKTLDRHYNEVSENMGYKVLPDESVVNGWGYALMQQKQYDKALAFFKLNMENYPQSFNVFDSMGDYYLERKDTTNAVASFKKALTIKDFPDTRKKLERISK
jgi:uncharacterized protein